MEKINNISLKLQNYTWEEIDSIVKEGKHKELFNIGDTKIFKIGNEIDSSTGALRWLV